MVSLLFILGGLTLGFSLVFFVAPKQISKCNLGDVNIITRKSKDKEIDRIINRVISIDEKISAVGQLMGFLLLVIAIVLFWSGYTLSSGR